MNVTITRKYKPWNKTGWELSCTGPRRWAERAMRKFLVKLIAVQTKGDAK